MCSFHDANIRITSLISGILFKLAVQVDFSQRYGQQAFIWVEQISVRHGLNTVGPIIKYGIYHYLLSKSYHNYHNSSKSQKVCPAFVLECQLDPSLLVDSLSQRIYILGFDRS